MSTRERHKELVDNARLLRAWKAWHPEQLEEALGGEHGDKVRRLLALIRNRTLKSAPQLIALIRSQDWGATDAGVQLEMLHIINRHITKLREAAGLPPFDDALPDEKPTGFLIARSMLGQPVLCPTSDETLHPAPRRHSEVHVLHRDYETRGVLLLNKLGAHRYAADPQTRILCAREIPARGLPLSQPR